MLISRKCLELRPRRARVVEAVMDKPYCLHKIQILVVCRPEAKNTTTTAQTKRLTRD